VQPRGALSPTYQGSLSHKNVVISYYDICNLGKLPILSMFFKIQIIREQQYVGLTTR
jgi:hypothetical protein